MLERREFLALAAAARLAGQSSGPAAIREDHFPNRLCQFVWRNWDLANVERMAEDHANARLLEAGISQIPGITMVSGPVETNMLYFDVSGTGMTSGEVADRMAERGVRIMSPYRYGSVIRAVTHLDVNREQCEEAVDILREVVSAA